MSENEPAWRGDGGRLAAEQAERASARETTGLGEPPPFCHQPRRPPSAYAALYPASSLRSPPFSASASSSSSFLRRRRRRCRCRRILYSLLLLLRRVLAAPFGRSTTAFVRSFVRSYVRVSLADGARAECSLTSARPVSLVAHDFVRRIYSLLSSCVSVILFIPKIASEAFAAPQTDLQPALALRSFPAR